MTEVAELIRTGIEELDTYSEGVATGSIEACLYVRQAVDRHYKDLERQRTEEFPYYFEPKAAQHFYDFCETHIIHFKGHSAGETLRLEPWQKFVWGSIYGWLKVERLKDQPLRRFKEGIIEINKKNGKSFMLAAQALYGLEMDGEPGAEIYGLAKNKVHASKLSYDSAAKIVKKNPEFERRFKVREGALPGIYCSDNDSYFEPLCSKPDSTDGLNIHLGLNDETKDWTELEMYDIVKDGTAGRTNPLIMNITTAGANRSSLGFERREYLIKVLNGAVTDETTFGIIYTIDKEDREDPEFWADPKNWKKANPNYGVSIPETYFVEQMSGCRESQRKLNSFLTKHLGLWISAMDNYFNMDLWTKGKRPEYSDWEERFAGKPCYVMLDLSSKKDLSSMYALFRDGETEKGAKRYAVFGVNFLPRYVIEENQVGKRSEYNAWAEQGHFILTEKNSIDEDVIEQELRRWSKLFRIKKVGFDPWGANHLTNKAESMRLEVILVKQTTQMLNDPTKTLDAWMLDHQLLHNGDPVLTWAMGNVVCKEDANENVFPRKAHRNSKIDPAMCLIGAVALEIDDPLPQSGSRRVPKVWKA
jgi:phage terminase large subunit-like protein